jgi:carbamate kinase
MPKTAVVALGGNALTQTGESGTHAEQSRHAAEMAEAVWALRQAGWAVVLVHGNGPQVGNLAIQQEEAAGQVPPQPLFCLDAMTQGHLGSLITMALHRVAGAVPVEIAALVTHIVVSLDDPAFAAPRKPIGPFFSKDEADTLARTRGWMMAEDAGRGYRRVVPSPHPRRIVESATLRALLDRGVTVIAAGGGGIPVVAAADAGYSGVDAVVDKDYAAQVLATSLRAEALVMLTGVRQVALHFGTPAQHAIDEMTVDDAERYLADGQFPEGSMGPKVRAGVRFLRRGGRIVVITTPDQAASALRGGGGAGKGGTRMVPSFRTVSASR